MAKIDQIWAWLSRGHRWAPGVRNPLKSLVMGPILLVNCYLEIKFHKKSGWTPPPPLSGIRRSWMAWINIQKQKTWFHMSCEKWGEVVEVPTQVDSKYEMKETISAGSRGFKFLHTLSIEKYWYLPNLWAKIYHIWCVCPNMGI